jgi:hypothetical protein
MAFCTNCGANMDANAHFCTKCGKSVIPAAAPGATSAPAQAYTPPASTYTPQPATSSGGGGAMKAILIVVGVFVVIGCVSLAALVFVAHRVKTKMRNGIHVTENGDNTVVETPFGRASSSKGDAKAVARQIGVDLYPGATSGESNSGQFGKMTTANIKLTTSDSVREVAKFYRSRYPNAMVSQENDGKFNLVGTDKDGTLTITAESTGDETRIEIAKVGGIRINIGNQ